MKKKKLEKKLRKKVLKFSEWGKRHGVPYASIYYMLGGFVAEGDFIYFMGETDGGVKVTRTEFLGGEDE